MSHYATMFLKSIEYLHFHLREVRKVSVIFPDDKCQVVSCIFVVTGKRVELLQKFNHPAVNKLDFLAKKKENCNK